MFARPKTVSTPVILLWVFALVYGLSAGMRESGELSKRAELAANIGLPFLLAFWVVSDARGRGLRICYDFDSFVFFAWPIVLPIYLFQTRGVRALWTALWFAGIWLFAWGVTVALVILRSR